MEDKLRNALRAPIELSWKPSNKFGDKLMCVCYLDSRDIQDRLDDVVGVAGWQTKFISQAGKLFCELSLKIDNEWITKSDVGIDTQVAADKGAASDALKRAAVHFGIGRFTYEVDSVLVSFTTVRRGSKDVDTPTNSQGHKLYGQKLSNYINQNFDKLSKV
jgi:hypothetical protein